MMKIVLLLVILTSTNLFAVGNKSRKMSSSFYVICHLEREAQDKKEFKKQYNFPLPSEPGEVYELKGSMRWNDFLIGFSQDGKVTIRITEQMNGERVTAEKTLQLGKGLVFETFKTQLEVKKDEVVATYHINCSPE